MATGERVPGPVRAHVDDLNPSHLWLDCPACGSIYIGHPRQPEWVESDDYPPGGSGLRGSYVAVIFQCEECHAVGRLVIQRHKGWLGAVSEVVQRCGGDCAWCEPTDGWDIDDVIAGVESLLRKKRRS